MNRWKRHISRVVLAGLLAACLGGCGQVRSTLLTSEKVFSTGDEIVMGEKIAPDFERLLGGRVEDEHVQRYVQRVGQKVAAVAGRRMPYEFVVLVPKVPNSFSLPGGKIYITAGMLDVVGSERQLAAVLANEVAHVTLRRPVKSLLLRMKGGLYLAHAKLMLQDLDESGYHVAVRMAREIIAVQCTRRDEMEADALAMRYLVRSGYSPWGLPEFLAAYHQSYRENPGRMLKMQQSHPLTLARVQACRVGVKVTHHIYKPTWQDGGDKEFLAIRNKALGLAGAPEVAEAEISPGEADEDPPVSDELEPIGRDGDATKAPADDLGKLDSDDLPDREDLPTLEETSPVATQFTSPAGR